MKSFLEFSYFESLKSLLFKNLSTHEHLLLSLSGEESQFIRISRSQIRQAGMLEDATLDITLTVSEQNSLVGPLRRAGFSFTLTGNESLDAINALVALKKLQNEVPTLPIDPYAETPKGVGSSSDISGGKSLEFNESYLKLLKPLEGLDSAGIYAAGPLVRAFAHSGGLTRFFRTENYSFDFSLYTPEQRALKLTIAGKTWDEEDFEKLLKSSEQKLAMLSKAPRKLDRGFYRVYLAPAAVGELVNLFSQQALSESAIRQGESPLCTSKSKESIFSKLFSLSEDFSSEEVPRFNEYGELSEKIIPLIDSGNLVQTLVNSRTAKEYGASANAANGEESLRSPAVGSGSLEESNILKQLEHGIYLANLHYLNWSDLSGGRITGMTRYACFWVEHGQIIAPIENMRFDDTVFSLFGESLEAVTKVRLLLPDVQTYCGRNLGGTFTPGLLVSKMAFIH